MYKLVAIDLDGTMLNSYGMVTENTKQVIKNTINKGTEVIIASGRPIDSIKTIAKEIGSENYFIAGNGALIYDIKKDEIIYEKFMNKQKVLEIIKNNNCNNFNLINFDSENQFPIIEYEKLINIGRYIENYSIDNLSKEENREKSTIIVSLAGEKKYSQQEFIESANVIAKTARIRKRKEMNALEQVNTFYEVVIGIILPMICGLNTKYFADNELIKNDLLIIEENNKNMVILYRKHKYLVEHTGINTYVARAEENLPAREHKKDTQNFVLIKTDKKDRIKNNKSQVTV